MNWIDRKIDELLEQGVGVRGVADEVLRTALQEAHTQGAQEALAKVEEWVKDRHNKINTEVGFHPDTYDIARVRHDLLDDLLHHLQQLKDNK